MTLNFFKTDFIYFLSVYVREFAMVCMRMSEYNLWSQFFPSHVGPRDQTLVVTKVASTFTLWTISLALALNFW